MSHDPYLQFLGRHIGTADVSSLPELYVKWLRTWPRLNDGVLTPHRIPKGALIVHDARYEDHLVQLGVPERRMRTIQIGTSSPNQLTVLLGSDSTPQLLINRGLPGGGGIGAQAAELFALGVTEIIHIGTCALLGNAVPSGAVLVSTGAYKDQCAVLLDGRDDSGQIAPAVSSDAELLARCEAKLDAQKTPHQRRHGFTIPSFYFQPASMIRDFVATKHLPGPQPVEFVEMENAALFAVARRMGKRAASLLVGSDRYTVENDELHHAYETDFDMDHIERQMLKAAAAAMDVALGPAD